MEVKRPARFVYRQRSSFDSTSSVMESEVRNLRQEVSRTQDSLRAATRRCRELVRELDGLSAEHERERLLRDQQLSRILRALLVLEARLKQEQKSIRQLLCEKDNVIRNQQLEIARLRRYTKSIIKGKREQQQQLGDVEKEAMDLPSLESSDYQDHDSGLSKDIQKLKCEIITKLNESMDDGTPGSNIRKTHSFAGSDISKTSLTSSENTDASIITTTTDGSPSLLSTEGFCEGESTDVSPGSTLNKSSSRCTPTIVTTDSETEVTMVILDEKTIARSESKDDGMDCNYASDEDEDDDEDEEDEPIYENNARNLNVNEDTNNNNNTSGIEVRITRTIDEPSQDESSGNWYSDPDEDRMNDEMLRHSVYRRPNGNHNSVLECVNQILLRDMEDEENILSVPRRFKHRGKIVRFQPARLSDIESVGSEMERRNSDEPNVKVPPVTITTTVEVHDRGDANDNETEPLIDGFEATNSEDEFGMRIVPVLDPESGLEEDVEETKARPIVIIEPCVKDEPMNNSIVTRSSTRNKKLASSPTDERRCKSLDYEDIDVDTLPEIITPALPKVPPALPPKPQFRNSTLVLKKIPSPSFLIDETSQKKQQPPTEVLGLGSKNPLTPSSVRSLKFEDIPKKRNDETASYWKNRFNNVRSSFQLRQQGDLSRVSPEPRKVTNIVKHFEEFKIEGNNDEAPTKKPPPPPTDFEVDEYDIQQNFEEFNLDECDLSSDDPDRPEADGSETFANSLAASLASTNGNKSSLENNNSSAGSNGNYDNFLEATGLSNKSILTPSRLLSNHKSMLKPKDVKYKSKIKATAVLERHGVASGPSTTHTRHWTGPFV